MLKDEKPLIETIPAGHVLFTYSWSDALFAKSTRSEVGSMGGVVSMISAIACQSSIKRFKRFKPLHRELPLAF